MPPSTLALSARKYLTFQIGIIHLTPQNSLIVLLALMVALLAAFRLARIAKQETRQARLRALRTAWVESADAEQPQRPRWYERLAALLASSPLIVGKGEQQRLLGVLAAAGIRRHGSLAMFIASKACSAMILVLLLANIFEWRQLLVGFAIVRLALFVVALLVGWRLPDIVLSRFAARRRLHIEQGLPDALDLLVICAEAGLSLDQSVEEVGRELSDTTPAVAEEFVTMAAEMRVLSDRGEALKNLVSRTGLTSLNSFAATLIQGIRFGTPLAESLRILAAEMRNERLARIEERAARLPVLLTLPLTVFVMPAMFMVLGTPIVLRIIDFMSHFTIPTLPGAGAP
jgi:tight adherence protein C